jgi:hypothetical protein
MVLLLAAAIVLMLGLSVAPNLHERLHPTAASLHECAVTLIASGSCHHTAAAQLMIAPATAVQFSKIPALTRRLRTPDPLVFRFLRAAVHSAFPCHR